MFLWQPFTSMQKEPSIKKKNQQKRYGRPRELSEREERNLIRQVYRLRETERNFFAGKVKVEACIDNNVSDRTVRRLLNHNELYYLQCSKKGFLSVRLQFARKMMKSFNKDVWEKEICFYLDGTSFIHKRNPFDQAKCPKSKVWRRKSEGLLQGALPRVVRERSEIIREGGLQILKYCKAEKL